MKITTIAWLTFGAVAALIMTSPLWLMGLWIGQAQWSNAHPDVKEHVSAVPWLPGTASNITHYRAYSFTAFEFDMSETDFISLATQRNWELREINAAAFKIRTWHYPAAFQKNRQHEEGWKAINSGLAYERRKDSGGGIAVAFDRSAGRAYVQENPR